MSKKTAFVIIVAMSALGLLSILTPLVVMMGKGSSFLSITGGRDSAKMFEPVISWIGLCYVLMALVLAGGILGLAGRAFKRALVLVSGAGTVLVPLVIISFPTLVWFDMSRKKSLFDGLIYFFKEPERVMKSINAGQGIALPLLATCFAVCFVLSLIPKRP